MFVLVNSALFGVPAVLSFCVFDTRRLLKRVVIKEINPGCSDLKC